MRLMFCADSNNNKFKLEDTLKKISAIVRLFLILFLFSK